MTKKVNKKPTPCSASLSSTHLSNLRKSRREARQAKSILNGYCGTLNNSARP